MKDEAFPPVSPDSAAQSKRRGIMIGVFIALCLAGGVVWWILGMDKKVGESDKAVANERAAANDGAAASDEAMAAKTAKSPESDSKRARAEERRILEAQQAAKRIGAINNMKSIGVALLEFDNEYGSYPNEETAKAVKEATGTTFKFEGGTSNDYFRQLLATGVKTEGIFQFGQPAKRADDQFATDAEALALGECDFAYLPGASASTDPSRPLVIGPMVPGKMEFDPAPFGGKAVVLRGDNSVTFLPINEKGEAISNGKSLLDPDNAYWGGKAPQVAWPK